MGEWEQLPLPMETAGNTALSQIIEMFKTLYGFMENTKLFLYDGFELSLLDCILAVSICLTFISFVTDFKDVDSGYGNNDGDYYDYDDED